MSRRSRFAAHNQFIDSHPILTPRKIMSDPDRLMLPGYRELCVTPLYFNGPLMSHRAGIHTRYHRICQRNILV